MCVFFSAFSCLFLSLSLSLSLPLGGHTKENRRIWILKEPKPVTNKAGGGKLSYRLLDVCVLLLLWVEKSFWFPFLFLKDMNKHRIVDYYFYLLLCNDAHVGAISTCSAHNVETVVFSLVPHEMGQSFSKKKKKKITLACIYKNIFSWLDRRLCEVATPPQKPVKESGFFILWCVYKSGSAVCFFAKDATSERR